MGDVADLAVAVVVPVVDVVLGEALVHADAEEIDELGAVREMGEGGAQEARLGVAGRVRHRVLADERLGVVAVRCRIGG